MLDAGCGTGRHAYFAARYGAREVVAVDLSDAVEAARGEPRAARQRARRAGRPPAASRSAMRPTGGGFDLIYSIGVLHHLPDPHEGFRALLPLPAARGDDRRVGLRLREQRLRAARRRAAPAVSTTKLPRSALRAVAWPLAVGFHGVAEGRVPTAARTRAPARRCRWTSTCRASRTSASARTTASSSTSSSRSDRRVHQAARSSRAGSRRAGLEDVRISHRHGNSWRGKRPRTGLMATGGRIVDIGAGERTRWWTLGESSEVEFVVRLRVQHDHLLRRLRPPRAGPAHRICEGARPHCEPPSCSRRCLSPPPSSGRWAPPTPFARPTSGHRGDARADAAAALVHAAAACPAGAGVDLAPDPVLDPTRPPRRRDADDGRRDGAYPENRRGLAVTRAGDLFAVSVGGQVRRGYAPRRGRPTGPCAYRCGSRTADGRSTAARRQ